MRQVKLFYARVNYQIHLGHLVSIWTPHTSHADTISLALQNACLATSIFPERDNSCYCMIQTNSDDGILCKKPRGYKPGKELSHLMTLKNFIGGGHEVADGKIMVCVKSIGGKRKGESERLRTERIIEEVLVTTKKGYSVDKVDVNIFDHTSEATLTLWGSVTSSASTWRASQTILLFTNAGFREGPRGTILIESKTHVDIDPCMIDAHWLQDYAQRLTKREHVNLPFPRNGMRVFA